MTSAWASFWYQYLVGGLIFLVGILFCLRQGEVGFKERFQRKNFIMLVGGFLLLFTLHLSLMLIGSGG